jgi:transcriptional regulator with XRE-family HTH domain
LYNKVEKAIKCSERAWATTWPRGESFSSGGRRRSLFPSAIPLRLTPASAYARFEAGEDTIALECLPTLTNLLGLSLDDLLQKKENAHRFHGHNAPIRKVQLAKNLLALRLYRGLSPRQEARELGIHKHTLLAYEKGKLDLPLTEAYRFMAFYDLSPDELLYERIPLPANEGTEKRDPKNLIFACVGGLLALALIIGFIAPPFLH